MGYLRDKAIDGLKKLNIGDSNATRNFKMYFGVVIKNYDNIKNHIVRNIGNNIHTEVRGGTVIGGLGDPEYTINLNESLRKPWFFTNKTKNKTQDYIEYITNTYYKDGGDSFILRMSSDDEIASMYRNSISDDKVGAVRLYERKGKVTLSDNGSVNPNNETIDSRIGIVNNYYLNSTLNASSKEYENNGSTASPTYGKNSKLVSKNSITQGAYSRFGLDGTYGLEGSYTIDGRVRQQSEIIGDIIPLSTTDHVYDSYVVGGGSTNNGNVNLTKNLFSDNHLSYININFADEQKDTNTDHVYDNVGNFYSITYSHWLMAVSGKKTQNLIARSVYGYDLLDDKYNDIYLTFDSDDVDENNTSTRTKYTGKKYYASRGTRGTNYIDAITCNDVYEVKENNRVIRIILNDSGNDNIKSMHALYSYAEADGNTLGTPNDMPSNYNYNGGIMFGNVYAYTTEDTSSKKDIIHYTNKRFQANRYDTLIGRFHTNSVIDNSEGRTQRDMTSTAVSKYGMSRGRNLLSKNGGQNKSNGYSDPYCRVWTFHKQYSRLADTIRPFYKFSDNGTAQLIKLSETDIADGREGQENLELYSSRQSNGLVKIAPTSNTVDDIRRCMFSIENLAWKTSSADGTKVGPIGPNGGRIMWFPPYDLSFNENVSTNWSPNAFIGRGEKIYTYTDTERGGNLKFKLLVDHPEIINKWRGAGGGEGIGDVNDVESGEQTVLRFFAGCEVLNGKPKSTKKKEEKTPSKSKPTTVTNPTSTYTEIYFYVFFPNNYSGKDDSYKGTVPPMWYLATGVGTSKVVNANGSVSDINPITEITQDDGSSVTRGYEMGTHTTNGSSKTSKASKTKTLTSSVKQGGKSLATIVAMGKNKSWSYWGYRVDKCRNNEVLYKKESLRKDPTLRDNYIDKTDFGYNAKNYSKITTLHSEAQTWIANGTLYSFADVFAAVDDSIRTYVDSSCFDDGRVAVLKNIFKNQKLVGIEVAGFASSHGTTESNKDLLKQRGLSVKAWLEHSPNVSKYDKVSFSVQEGGIGPTISVEDVNVAEAKLQRCARVKLRFEKEARDNINHEDNEKKRLLEDAVSFALGNNITNASDMLKNAFNNVQTMAAQNTIEENKEKADVELAKAKATTNSTTDTSGGYDFDYDESKYFTELEANEPFLHSKLVDKIKYFDPAFHSITPEGFNARLTFLHQCTRQGDTMSTSDKVNSQNIVVGTAKNLAFGAPPVCVLRIGDFYNTRIIIESLNIDYANASWDLNDEGIGVMPMMADVTIGFKFIGGSDIQGPIRRLQNAVSFNYYANTSVYDGNNAITYDAPYNLNIKSLSTSDTTSGLGTDFETDNETE